MTRRRGLPASFRYELRSDEQLREMATGPLLTGVDAGPARRSMHRDLYLDTPDDALHHRGVLCRLRLGIFGENTLSLRVRDLGNGVELRLDSRVMGNDVRAALMEDSLVGTRLRAIVDSSLLQSRLELEVERLTRTANRDLLRRPRLELHFDRVTVRRDALSRTFHLVCGHVLRGGSAPLAQLAAALERMHELQPLDGDLGGHARLLLRWAHGEVLRTDITPSDEMPRPSRLADGEPPELLNAELSLLAFQRRVLALAEDPQTPLRARLRFLGIVTSNLDELYMVRMPALRRAANEPAQDAVREPDGLNARERLLHVEREVESILAAQSKCVRACLRAAGDAGVRLVQWDALDGAARARLRDRCRDEIQPGLTPLAMTMSPGHPLPHLPHLALSLAVVFRHAPDAAPHLAELELPRDASRLLEIAGRPGDRIAIEEVLRHNLDLLYPHTHVDGAWLFRVTRGGELALDEDHVDDLLDAVAQATERRPANPAVRVEAESSMPHFVGELVLENLRRDALAAGSSEVVDLVQIVDGLLDPRCLVELPIADIPALEYAPLAETFDADASLMGLMRTRDVLVHHPFVPFDDTVVRFLREAASDPAVTTVKITLYRVGESSPIVAALLDAARAGKRVVALVELKARFDEENNVGWARALERAGGHVVYGLVGLKVHAKLALVVRQEEGRLRRYAHVGTGNYNARSGRQYTDLSLFSVRDPLTSDVADLFNELTGSAQPPQGLQHGALVAPHQLLPAILGRIERETMHARAGRPARIAIKVNGLSDPEVIRALYRASEAGVTVDLIVRGICTLRPGVPGRSSRIRVVSVVGRFLEHSRIYRFEDDGAPEFFIGSSDLRPRNLRRRVELLIPVIDAEQRTQLEHVLELYLNDPTAWELNARGEYVQRANDAPGAQAVLAEEHSPLAFPYANTVSYERATPQAS